MMTRQTWGYLALAYLFFYGVAIVVERQGMARGSISPLERILTALILWSISSCSRQAPHDIPSACPRRVRGLLLNECTRHQTEFTPWVSSQGTSRSP